MTSDEILFEYGYHWTSYDKTKSESRCRKLIAFEFFKVLKKENSIKFFDRIYVNLSLETTLYDRYIHHNYVDSIKNGLLYITNGTNMSGFKIDSIPFDLGIKLLILIENKKYL